MDFENIRQKLIDCLQEDGLSEESLANAYELLHRLAHSIGSSPEEIEHLRIQLSDEQRTYASRILYQK